MKQLIAGFFVLVFFEPFTFAQNMNATLANYANKYGQERIYLHYDKSSYGPGETIWFKAYLMQAIDPGDQSKTVYVDWTDASGKVLLHGSGPVIDATSFGQFQIPEDYKDQYIHVRAYTKWMLNFDSAFLYNKDIRILSDSARPAHTKNTIIPELTFFPEGGDAVEGITNKIAFKANDQYGNPVNSKGVIKDNTGKEIARLNVIHDGMGYFFITPKVGQTFTATWTDESGKSHSTPLPAIKETGVSLQVIIAGTKRNFFIKKTSSTSFSSVHIIGTMYQQPIFNITKEFKDGLAEGTIPTEALPSGIMTITVFDNQWNPLAERITYVNNEEYRFEPTMTVQHWGLNKRARNEIEIDAPDSISANMSVSVTDLGIDHDTSDNIISHLMLTGELKGKVNNPTYYFANNSDTMMQQLDLVMLTHGWRRFNWEKVVKGDYPTIKYPKDTTYLSLSGKVYGATPSRLREAGSIILMVTEKDKSAQLYTTPVNADGTFDDSTLILFDTARVYYQLAKTQGASDISVQFMPNRLPPLSHNVKASGIHVNNFSDTTGNDYHIKLNDAAAQELKYLQGKVLATVNIVAKPSTRLGEMDKKYTSGMFSGGDNFQFDVIDDPRALSSTDIFQYLQGRVAGLQITGTGNNATVTWRNATPQIYVDEMLTSIDMVSSVPVTDIAYIKVFRPPFMGGMGGGSAGGAIAIYTKRGNDQKQEPGKGLSNNSVSGYTAIRQFYSPDYESFSEDKDKKDLRTTLYWNPSVTTSPGKNKVILKFFNNDITQAFRVVIEGMTRDGRLAHVEQVME